MIKEFLAALPSWIALALAKLVMFILGVIIFPVGYFFLEEQTNPDGRKILNYPKWLWPWGNDRDGFLGDKRGWWADNTPWGLSVDHFVSMLAWGCLRNPCNNAFRFTRGIGCFVKECKVSLISGQHFVRDKVGSEGFQFVKADGPTFNYWGIYYVSKWIVNGKHLLIRIGHKVEPRHNTYDWSQVSDQKAWKGFTFRIGLQHI